MTIFSVFMQKACQTILCIALPTVYIMKLHVWVCSKVWYVINILLVFFTEVIEEFFNTTWRSRHNQSIPDHSLTFLWSLSVSIKDFGALLGSLGVKGLADTFGRWEILLFKHPLRGEHWLKYWRDIVLGLVMINNY